MDKANSAKHITALQNMTLQFGDKVYDIFFHAAESRLLEMMDTAKNNDDQWQLMQLSRELRKQKSAISARFKLSLSESFNLFRKDQLGGKDTSKEDMSRDLSLLADEELEQDIAVSSIARRADTRFSEDLFGLMQRLAVLRGGRKLPDDGNPLGANQFATALQASLKLLKLNIRFTVMFFRVFEKALLENLGELYQSANEYLKRQGVLPNLRFGMGLSKPTPATGAPKKPAEAAAGEEGAAAADSEADVVPHPARIELTKRVEMETLQNPAFQQSLAAERQLYADISRLQHGAAAELPVNSPTPPAAPRPQYFSQPAFSGQTNAAAAVCSSSEVVTALSQVSMEHHAEAMDYIAVPPAMTVEQYQNVTQQMKNHLGDDKRIAEEDGRIIDLVGMIFEYMLGDEQLPDAVKAVLSYLHTPYLKVAFLERKLFEKPEHSSRQLLDCLADAGMRWVNTDGDSQFKVFPKIKSVIRRVLTDFHNDTSLFDELLLEMREFNVKVARSVDVMERRAREKAEGEERLREVKRRVLQEVRSRMDGHELPAHIIVLLLHPWSDFLTFTLLRYGDHSSQWQEGVDIIDEVIWSVQEKTDVNERNRLAFVQESLLQRVQGGLETVAHDQVKSNRLLEALSKSHMLVLQNLIAEPASPEKRAEMEAEVSAELTVDVIDKEALAAEEMAMLETLSQAPVGTWLEFDQVDGGSAVRARIAWVNPNTSNVMLVDRSGKQMAIKNGLEIARMILASQARILVESGKPFFERALENILVRLKAIVAH
ncbi:MAG TPA: DUF1631 family protein [Pseudomonadales bacterium]|jgi:hypothetical protein|nr:DUF1631 family protein [Pseudomonadales bacterium]HNI36816.1 DUF1631 family protein [Pseudomonadales bacterium]HNN86140.1 DUF1631 family protein [Pseudomonadales bacterium]